MTSSGVLGARLKELLRLLDQVAYVRFASVYREFKDVRDFVDNLNYPCRIPPISTAGSLLVSDGASAPSDLIIS